MALGRRVRRTSTSAKGCSSALLEALGVAGAWSTAGRAFLHPGRRPRSVVDAREAGWLGELHPSVARDFGLDELERPPAVLELDLGLVLAAAGGARAAATRT